MGRTLFFAMMLIVLGAFPALSKNVFRCDIERKSYCNFKGCFNEVIPFEEYKVITLKRNGYFSYKLCHRPKKQEPVQCMDAELFPGQQRDNGIFLTIPFVQGEGKIATFDNELMGIKVGDFFEMRSALLGSFSSFGKCRVVEQ